MDDFQLLSRQIKEIQGHDRLFMAYSTGADATAAWLRCLESDEWDPKESVLYYYYHTPMSWTWEYLDWFEDHFGVTVERVPSHLCLESLANWYFQTPARAEAIVELAGTPQHFGALTKKQIQTYTMYWAGLPDTTLVALGVKSGDSPMRRKAMRQTQGVSQRQGKWYPIWDFENRDAIDIIKRHNCKVPYDYELFGITFEQLDYRFSKVLKTECPNNWARVLERFPMAETIISRREYYHPDWPLRKGVMYRKFGDLVLQPKEPL